MENFYNFFVQPWFFFEKNLKNVKKFNIKETNFSMNVWPIRYRINFFSFKIFIFPFFLNVFPQISHFWKNGPDKGGGDYWVSTDQTVQKYWGLGIFHTPWHVWGVWKIAKNQSHLVKFGCGNPGIYYSFLAGRDFFCWKK